MLWNNFIPARDYRQARSPAFYTLSSTIASSYTRTHTTIQSSRVVLSRIICLDSQNVGEPVLMYLRP